MGQRKHLIPILEEASHPAVCTGGGQGTSLHVLKEVPQVKYRKES